MSCPQTQRARADQDPPGPSLRAFLRWGRGPAPGPLRADQLDQLPCMPPRRLFDEPAVNLMRSRGRRQVHIDKRRTGQDERSAARDERRPLGTTRASYRTPAGDYFRRLRLRLALVERVLGAATPTGSRAGSAGLRVAFAPLPPARWRWSRAFAAEGHGSACPLLHPRAAPLGPARARQLRTATRRE